MNRTEHLLTILGEECCEVAQRASKALRFGLHEVQPGHAFTNEARLTLEIYDVLALIEMLKSEGLITSMVDRAAMERKKVKVEEFLKYSEECGTLTRDTT